MGIILVKCLKRMKSLIKIIIWKILYLSRIKVGKSVIFYPNTKITIDKNGKIVIGNNCFFNNGCSLNSLGLIRIGNNCIFGEDVKIYDHNHKYKDKTIPIRKQGYIIGSVIIGDNCWIGSNTIILSNVKIGNNVVIGAGSIITKDVPDNSVIVGNVSVRKLG